MSKLTLVALDAELVARAKSGDRDAFGKLAERYRAMCIRLAFRIMRRDADVEDQVQTALLKAYRHIGQFNSDAAFSTWLAGITINQCKMALRSARRAPPVALATVPRKLRPVSRLHDPETAYARRELFAIIRVEAARIPPIYRDALIRDTDDLTVPEIARRFGISHSAAKSRLFRAREKLRMRIEKRFPRGLY